jgi:hypothetical protein
VAQWKSCALMAHRIPDRIGMFNCLFSELLKDSVGKHLQEAVAGDVQAPDSIVLALQKPPDGVEQN